MVEISVVEMSDSTLLPGFSTYLPYSKRIDSILKNTTATKDAWTYSQVSHIFRFNNEVFQRAMFYRNKLDDDWYYDHTITERLIREVKNYPVTFKVPEKHVQDIKQLADYCRAHNINLKLVIGPFFPKYVVNRLDVLKKRVEEATGYPVHDYSYALQSYDSFTDYLHANLKGGRQIVDMMIKDSVLPVVNTGIDAVSSK